MTKRRNPLHKRYVRQLTHDFGKYLGILLLLLITVAFVSCFLMSISSIRTLLDNQTATCSIEDARVETADALTESQRQKVADTGAALHDLYSREVSADTGGQEATMRLYKDRDGIDTPTYYSGAAPATDTEIAVDKTFAANHGLAPGSTVTLGGRTFTVSGIMVLPDYSALMQDNNDIVMNAISFCVGLVTPGAFDSFSDAPIRYTYALTFPEGNLSPAERADREQDIVEALVENGAEVTLLLDREQNKGITYASQDMDGDSAIYIMLGYVLVGIMAFIFVVLTNATIERESSVIGTLLASGWRKGEVIRHYLFLPAVVGLCAIALGNLLGYTVLVGPVSGLYYNSYSFPPFAAQFDPQAFVLTSVIPYALLVGITLAGLAWKLRATPLAFLRHEVRRRRTHRSLKLPESWGFIARFRCRITLRNISTFVILFLGICLGNILLLFGTCILPVFENYADAQAESVPAEYIYTLKAPYELEMSDEQQDLRDKLASLAGMEEGIGQLESGGQALAAGATALASGTSSAKAGAEQLADGASRLSQGASSLEAGSKAFAEGLEGAAREQEAAADEIDLGALQKSYADALSRYVAAVAAAGADQPSGQAAVSATEQSAEQPAASAAGPNQASGQNPDPVQSAYQELSDATKALVSGVAKKGAAQGAAGAASKALESFKPLSEGIASLAGGGAGIASGADGLNKGIGTLSQGSSELASGLGGYQNGIDALLEAAREQGSGDSAEALAEVIHPVAEEGSNTQEAIGQAEKICIAGFETARPGNSGTEEVTVYGIQPDSHYWEGFDVSDGRVLVGAGLAEKCNLQEGGTVVLFDKYTDEYHALPIDGFAGNKADTSIYLSQGAFNKAFGHDGSWFNGYASNEKLTFDGTYLAGTTTPDDMQKIADQMTDSFSDIVSLLQFVALLVFFVVMYLLTKTILDRSSRSISYMKVFGYRNREVNKLYLTSVTVMVAASLVVSLPLVLWALTSLFKVMLMRYPGNFIIAFPPELMAICLVMAFATYLLVSFVHMRTIRRVPLSLALKSQE